MSIRNPRSRAAWRRHLSSLLVLAIALSWNPSLGASSAGATDEAGKSGAVQAGQGRFTVVEPLATTTGDPAPAHAEGGSRAEAGTVIVRFREGVRPGASGRSQAHVRSGGRSARPLRFARDFEVVEVPPGLTARQLAERYAREPGVLYAEPDTEVQLASAAGSAHVAVPDDTYFGRQWGLRNDGQRGGTPEADIGVLEAWRTTRGSADVIVAVIDTGVDHTHVDLASRMVEGLGYDFIDDDADPMDGHGHGTHVASIIAASADDGFGVAGVAPDVRIMALRVFDDSGKGATVAGLVDAFAFAEAHGADIVNASWVVNTEHAALREAIAGSSALVVAAAGNNNADIDMFGRYPAAWNDENILAVAATDRYDTLAGFSNRGANSVDVAAPGVDILGAIPGREDVHFYDDFSDLSAWVSEFGRTNEWGLSSDHFTSSSSALADSPGAHYANEEDSFVRTREPIDLTDAVGARLEFEMLLDTESGFDGVRLRVHDGISWTDPNDATWSGSTGGSFDSFVVDLSAYEGRQVRVGFQFLSDDTIVGQGVHIDDLRIVSSASSGPSNRHAYLSGTSMAAPHAAGVAALALAAAPGLNAPDLRNILRGSSNPLPALAGKVATGGRIDTRELFTVRATDVERLWGSDRYATAVALAKEAYPGFEGVEYVVVASGEDRAAADPLAAAGLAGVLQAPLLLVRSGGLPPIVRSTLVGLPDDVTVIVIGGGVAVSKQLETELLGLSSVSEVQRIEGPNRYATARRIADRMRAELQHQGRPIPETALFANGADAHAFYDALALSAVSANNHFPVLLLERDRVPAETAAALQDHDLPDRIVGGGPAVVSDSVVSTLGADRWSGPDRYATAAVIASRAVDAGYSSYGFTTVAAALPDAVAGGAMAGSRGGVLLLTHRDRLTPVTANAILSNRSAISRLSVLGGPASVTEAVRTDMRSLLP